MNIYGEKWTIDCNGHKYTAIGYENRGIFGVPIATIDITTKEAISATVFEIINGFEPVPENSFISATRLNGTEIALLEKCGCQYNGCFISRV